MKKIITVSMVVAAIIAGVGFFILNQKANQISNTEIKTAPKESATNLSEEDYSQLPTKIFIDDANFQTQIFGGATETMSDGVTTISVPKNELFAITQPIKIKDVHLGYEIVIPAGFSFINDALRGMRPEEYIDPIEYCKTYSKYGEGTNCITFQLDASGFDNSNMTLRDKVRNASFDSVYQQTFSSLRDHPYITGGYGIECNQPNKALQNKVVCSGNTEELPELISNVKTIRMTAKLSKEYVNSNPRLQGTPGESIQSIAYQSNYTIFSEPLFSSQRNSIMNILVTGDSEEFLGEAEKIISSLHLLSADDVDVTDYVRIQAIRDVFGRATLYFLKKKEIPKSIDELEEFQKPREIYSSLSLDNESDLIKNLLNQKQLLYTYHVSTKGMIDGYRVGINLMNKNHPYFKYDTCDNGQCLLKAGYGSRYFPSDNVKGCSGEDQGRCFSLECTPLNKNIDTNHQLYCGKLMFNAI